MADEHTKPSSTTASDTSSTQKPTLDPQANHGRYGYNDYSGCDTQWIEHPTLKVGDSCPECTSANLHGILYAIHPGVVIRLEGNPLISGTRTLYEKLRCSLCGEQYVAGDIKEQKERQRYSASARSSFAIGRYYAGLPFKRIEMLQRMQNIPTPDSTLWDEVKHLWQQVQPVYRVLEHIAAQSKQLYFDDTPGKILLSSQAMAHNRKGVYTTAIVSECGEHKICLYYTGIAHAGENMSNLLKLRETDATLFTMSDASNNNINCAAPAALLERWVICFCLVHGRRRFYEIKKFFDKQCALVLDVIGGVYLHEKHCKEQDLSSSERLLYHQKHSKPLMESLYTWLNNQLLYEQVEANSGLGEAVRYLLKYWELLTRFLYYEGAPLDNSLCERAIKVAIRHRRNSLFYRSDDGAKVGDGLMSIIHTARHCGINVYDYLTQLQHHHPQVKATPELWLPWCYQITMADMKQAA